jgi:hypothetical protein
MNRLCQDSINVNHRGTQAQPFLLRDRHYSYVTTQLATSASKQKYQVNTIDLGSPSCLSNWFVDTGDAFHMTTSLEDLVHVDKGPGVFHRGL